MKMVGHYDKRMQFVGSSVSAAKELVQQNLCNFGIFEQCTALPCSACHEINACLSDPMDNVGHSMNPVLQGLKPRFSPSLMSRLKPRPTKLSAAKAALPRLIFGTAEAVP
jgi:hypothetical protein